MKALIKIVLLLGAYLASAIFAGTFESWIAGGVGVLCGALVMLASIVIYEAG